MLLIVTGNIGIGKSTICRKIVDIARVQGWGCGGIITLKTPEGNIIVENLQNNERMVLASPDRLYEGPQVGKYYFSPEGIAFGRDAITSGNGLPLVIIDEIGPLELRGEGFTNAIRLVSEKISNYIVVIRKQLLSPFILLFDDIPLVIETTIYNRDILHLEILRILASQFNAVHGSYECIHK